MLIVGNSLFLNGNITNGGQIQITFNSGNGVAITGIFLEIVWEK